MGLNILRGDDAEKAWKEFLNKTNSYWHEAINQSEIIHDNGKYFLDVKEITYSEAIEYLRENRRDILDELNKRKEYY